MKLVRLTDSQWEVFLGALNGLRFRGAMGDGFYAVSPLIDEAVAAVRDAEDEPPPSEPRS